MHTHSNDYNWLTESISQHIIYRKWVADADARIYRLSVYMEMVNNVP